MDLGLADRVVLVSGGASGIGKAITRACLAEGARVVVLSRISSGVPEFIEEMQAGGHPCELVEAELDQPAACESAVRHVEAHYGSLYALVNNAGINDGVSLGSGSPERFQRSLALNLSHCYALAHFALPLLQAARGCIVNIGSKVAVTGQGNTSGYAAAKGALLALTREWAAELLECGVRVNCVVPAEVITPLYRSWLNTLPDPEARLAQIARQIPLEGRPTRPEEIASAVAFLLSPRHSGHTTGQHVYVDGGYVHLDRMLTAGRIS